MLLHPAALVISLLLPITAVLLFLHRDSSDTQALALLPTGALVLWLYRLCTELDNSLMALSVIRAPHLLQAVDICWWVMLCLPAMLLTTLAAITNMPPIVLLYGLAFTYALGFAAIGTAVVCVLVAALVALGAYPMAWLPYVPLLWLPHLVQRIVQLRRRWRECVDAAQLAHGEDVAVMAALEEYEEQQEVPPEASTNAASKSTLRIHALDPVAYLLDRWLPISEMPWRWRLTLLLAPIAVDAFAALVYAIRGVPGDARGMWLYLPLLIALVYTLGKAEGLRPIAAEQMAVSTWPINALAAALRRRIRNWILGSFDSLLALMLGTYGALILIWLTGQWPTLTTVSPWVAPVLIILSIYCLFVAYGFAFALRGAFRWLPVVLLLAHPLLAVVADIFPRSASVLLVGIAAFTVLVTIRGWTKPCSLPLMLQLDRHS